MLTVHHLQHSQSERILWLLEELKIPYQIVLHQRDPVSRLSPPSLKEVHTLGTAPVIVDDDDSNTTTSGSSKALTLSESGAIAHYILGRYAPADSHLTVGPSSPDFPAYLYWLYFVLCSLQPSGSATMLSQFDRTLSADSLARKFPLGRFQRHLGLVEARLAEPDVQYLAGGDDVSLADIMALWVFTTFRDFLPYSLKPYPAIVAYVQRLTAREAYRKAWEKGEGQWEGFTGVEPGDREPYF